MVAYVIESVGSNSNAQNSIIVTKLVWAPSANNIHVVRIRHDTVPSGFGWPVRDANMVLNNDSIE